MVVRDVHQDFNTHLESIDNRLDGFGWTLDGSGARVNDSGHIGTEQLGWTILEHKADVYYIDHPKVIGVEGNITALTSIGDDRREDLSSGVKDVINQWF